MTHAPTCECPHCHDLVAETPAEAHARGKREGVNLARQWLQDELDFEPAQARIEGRLVKVGRLKMLRTALLVLNRRLAELEKEETGR